MSDLYELRFQTIKMGELWRYHNADPRDHSNTTQIIPDSEILEDHWDTEVVVIGGRDRFGQYNNLARSQLSGRQGIRGVSITPIEVAVISRGVRRTPEGDRDAPPSDDTAGSNWA